jgi:hypothetical protein
VRYRLMATYQGSPFEAGIGPAQGDIVLFAACPPPEELGFEPATGHWRKQLRLGDVQAVWESRPVGMFRGERCMVVDDLGDRLHIGFLGHDGFKAEQLGYWQVDRGVFELVAPRSEVTEILEERTEYRPPAVARPATGPHPVVSADSSGYGRPSERPSGQYSVPPGYSPGSSGQYPAPAGYKAGISGQHHNPAAQGQPGPSSGHSGQYQAPAPAAQGQPGPSAGHTGQYQAPAPPAQGQPGPSAGHSGQYQAPAGYDQVAPAAGTSEVSGDLMAAAYVPVPDASTGIALPVAAQAPLPLEAEAMRAASASRRPRPAARRGSPGRAAPPPPANPAPASPGITQDAVPAGEPRTSPQARQRRSARSRLATERLFADLATLAGVPADSYAVGEVVQGALCLVQTEQGFEVFHSAGASRQELQVFATEESACFYLFGVLAAEAVRNGSLARIPTGLGPGQPASA